MLKKIFGCALCCLSLSLFAQPFIKIGHRGARDMALYPENTIAAFKFALSCGVDAVECDVQQCKTGELVVIHRKKAKELLLGAVVAEKTLQELQQLDVGKGEHVPTFEQLLDYIDRRVIVFIDIKAPDIEEAVVKILQKYIREKGWLPKHFVLANDYNKITICRDLMPEIKRMVPYFPEKEATIEDLSKRALIIVMSTNEKNIEQYIDSTHKAGSLFYIGDIDTQEDIEKYTALGVDGILSDRPDLF